jgi:hypothetical protein
MINVNIEISKSHNNKPRKITLEATENKDFDALEKIMQELFQQVPEKDLAKIKMEE